MITDDHRAKAREIVAKADGGRGLIERIAQALSRTAAEQQEKDARIAEREEPTAEMIEAGTASHSLIDIHVEGEEMVRAAWKAMRAAAIRAGGGNG